MQALIHKNYGSTDNLRLEEVPRPIPKSDEVLLKIMATGVNSWDGDMILGRPFIYRLLFGLFKPRYPIIGCDVAGVVEAVGSEITRFKQGDRVFGDLSEAGWGGFAEYVATKETALTHIPANVSFEDAAAIPQAGLLTLQSLRFNGRIRPGDHVLFNGAGGGVGTLGLQLAQRWGAIVTVVDHESKLIRLKEIGADHMIDYTKVDYTKAEVSYNLIIDVIAMRPFKEYEKVVKPEGGMAIVGGRVKTLLEAGLTGKLLSKKTGKKLGIMGQQYRLDDLDYLISLVSKGKLKPIIGEIYPLTGTPQALQSIIEGAAFGKLVIKIG